MKYKLLKKEDMPLFVKLLLKNYKVIAPVKKDEICVFDEIKDYKEIASCLRPLYSFKKFLLPPIQDIFSYKDNKISINLKVKKQILFGIRSCDANALAFNDHLFIEEYNDPYYKKIRQNTIVIVNNCIESGENCYCRSLGTHIPINFDLSLKEEDSYFIVEIGSEIGEKLTSNKLFKNTNKGIVINLKNKKSLTKIELKRVFNSFNNPLWKEYGEKCLSCCACINVCPTCNCFDIKDFPHLNRNSGSREREWDYCMLSSFTQIAGGLIFRKEREKRLRHRVLHKFKYDYERYGTYSCVGCGRCVEVCIAGIDFFKIIKEM